MAVRIRLHKGAQRGVVNGIVAAGQIVFVSSGPRQSAVAVAGSPVSLQTGAGLQVIDRVRDGRRIGFFRKEEGRRLVVFVVYTRITGQRDPLDRAIRQPHVVAAVLAIGVAERISRVPIEQVRVDLVAFIKTPLKLYAIDLRKALRDKGVFKWRPKRVAGTSERSESRVLPKHGFVVLAKGPHRSRILDRGVFEFGLEHWLNFNGRPVNHLLLAENMADIVGRGAGIDVKTMCRRVGLPFTRFFLPPYIEPPLEIVRDLPVEFSVQLLDSNRVLLTNI
jgi:hypothetical protein